VPLGLPELPEDMLNCLRVTEMEAGAKKNPCENFNSGGLMVADNTKNEL